MHSFYPYDKVQLSQQVKYLVATLKVDEDFDKKAAKLLAARKVLVGLLKSFTDLEDPGLFQCICQLTKL